MSRTHETFNSIRMELLQGKEDYNETNDCSVLAWAAVTGQTYEVAHWQMSRAGRDRRRGCSATDLEMVSVDWIKNHTGKHEGTLCPAEGRWEHVSHYGCLVRGINVRTFAALSNPSRAYLVMTEQHVTAVVGGRVYDAEWLSSHKVMAFIELPLPNGAGVTLDHECPACGGPKRPGSRACESSTCKRVAKRLSDNARKSRSRHQWRAENREIRVRTWVVR